MKTEKAKHSVTSQDAWWKTVTSRQEHQPSGRTQTRVVHASQSVKGWHAKDILWVSKIQHLTLISELIVSSIRNYIWALLYETTDLFTFTFIICWIRTFLEPFLFSGPKLHMTPKDQRRDSYSVMEKKWRAADKHVRREMLLCSHSLIFFSWNSPCLCFLKMKINGLTKNFLVHCVLESCWTTTTLALNIFCGGQYRSYKKQLFISCLYRVIDMSQLQSFFFFSPSRSPPAARPPRPTCVPVTSSWPSRESPPQTWCTVRLRTR